MCGGSLDLPENISSGECPYCGTLTTFPKISGEHQENLYNRAEHFRRINEYDKAVAAYEKIVEATPDDPEAYWGLVLSRFGIEYVEDPLTHERIPTCHRVQFESILNDADYLAALDHAGSAEKEIYENEAKRIADIQKNILRVSNQEKPFDVFICYKETTDGGSRTKDSALAQDIYYQLTNAGYKVFFSRITLESKLGQQYEPYIFAALNSAKVMLVIGSKKEYFEAVWVRNEWSRFLALMKKDRSKLLIPCYKDMDAYDIPDELSMFQAQDMGKIGFLQDIIHGIKKVIGKEQTAHSAGTVNSNAGTSGTGANHPLLRRAKLFLQNDDFDSAKEYCEKTLDSEPENGWAYFYRLMAELQVNNEDELADCDDLESERSFRLAEQFADNELKAAIAHINQLYCQRKEKEEQLLEEQRQQEAERKKQERERLEREEKERQIQAQKKLQEDEARKKDNFLRQGIANRIAILTEHLRVETILYKRAEIISMLSKCIDDENVLYRSQGLLTDAAIQPALTASAHAINCAGDLENKKREIAARAKKKLLIVCGVIFSIIAVTILIFWMIRSYRYNNGIDVCEIDNITVTGTVDKNIVNCMIPDTVAVIGDSAFSDCKNLTSVTLPSGIHTIKTEAFSGCTSLNSIELPGSVTTIESAAFSDSGLSKIKLPDKITLIAALTFARCSALTDIEISENIDRIESDAFIDCNNLQSVKIPYHVQLDENAFPAGCEINFYYCEKHKDKNLCILSEDGQNVTGTYGKNLTSITVPEGTAVISGNAFQNCRNLKTAILPKGISEIEFQAFNGCSRLEEVTIAESITSIACKAFDGCEKLTNISIPYHTMLVNGSLPENCQINFYYCSKHKNKNAGILSNDKKTVIGVISKKITSCTIPRGVTGIGVKAFSGCSLLEDILLPDGISIIGNEAFAYCRNLTSITLPESVKEVADSAFKDSGLKKIKIPYHTDIDTGKLPAGCEVTFYYCSDHNPDNTAVLKDSTVTEAISRNIVETVLPYGITAIAAEAFRDCRNLVDISIPETIQEIHANAFHPEAKLEKIRLPLHVKIASSALPANCKIEYYDCRLHKNNNYCTVEKRNGEVIVTGVINKNIKTCTIPENATAIYRGAFAGCSNLESITIPENITDIGDYAFQRCSKLSSIVLPKNLKKIGSNAFDGCSNLREIAIPESVNIIGSYAFRGCSELSAVNFPKQLESIGSKAFAGCHNLKTINIPDSITSLNDCFAESGITSVTIPDMITKIGDDAFKNCSSLSEISIPEGVSHIGQRAFYGCSNLTKIKLPASLVAIGDGAFSYTSISELIFPEKINSIGSKIITGCKNLEKIEIPYGMVTLGRTLSESSIKTVIIPDTVTDILDYAFFDCRQLENVKIPSSVKKIGKYAFKDCRNLAEIIIPDNVKEIDNQAFSGTALKKVSIFRECSYNRYDTFPYGCEVSTRDLNDRQLQGYDLCVLSNDGKTVTGVTNRNAQKIIIPDGVTTIGDSAFAECENLTSITIPESVTKIERHAFYCCYGLKEVVIPQGVTKIGKYAFDNCHNLSKISIPASMVLIDDGAFSDCYKLESLQIPANCEIEAEIPYNCTLSRILTDRQKQGYDLCVLSDDRKEISRILYKEAEKIIVPDGVTRINSYAFQNCENLTSIAIPGSVTEIGSYAFANCTKLKEVCLPVTCQYERTSFPNGCKITRNLTERQKQGYDLCTLSDDSKTVTGPVYKDAKKIIIPDGVAEIGYGAFRDCKNLTTVTIPDSVTKIESYAFQNCQKLTDVKIPDSVVVIGQNAFYNCAALEEISLPVNCKYSVYSSFPDGCKITRTLKLTERQKQGYDLCKLSYDEKTVTGTIYKNVEKIIIPDGVTEIGHEAFKDCKNLTTVTIPDSVKRIGNNAFAGCVSLKEISIPNGVNRIESYAFRRCTNLTEINLPVNCQYERSSFPPNCKIIKTMTDRQKQGYDLCELSYDKKTVTGTIYKNAEKIIIPDGVAEIGNEAFRDCKNLTSVTIPDSVNVIRYRAFDGCVNLKEISIPDGVNRIESCTFRGCTSLTSVTIPDSVEQIDNYAFEKCVNLIEISIPNGVKYINYYSFKGCSNLTNITIPDSVKNIGSGAFAECESLKKVSILRTCQYSRDSFPKDCQIIRRLSAKEKKGIDVCKINYDAVYDTISEDITRAIIPFGVKTIKKNAFKDCTKLIYVEVPDSVTKIETDAFKGCSSLRRLSVPRNCHYESYAVPASCRIQSR